MSGFFSGSSSSRRYPNLNMRGKHYKKKGLFGMIPGMGSFSGSDSYSGYGGYPNQGYPNQGYPNQGYPNQNYGNQGYPDQGYAGQTQQTNQGGYQQNPVGGQGTFQPNMPAQTSGGQTVCPKCGASVPAGSKFCLSCGEKMAAGSAAFCANCGKPLPAGAKFCPDCGTPVQR